MVGRRANLGLDDGKSHRTSPELSCKTHWIGRERTTPSTRQILQIHGEHMRMTATPKRRDPPTSWSVTAAAAGAPPLRGLNGEPTQSRVERTNGKRKRKEWRGNFYSWGSDKEMSLSRIRGAGKDSIHFLGELMINSWSLAFGWPLFSGGGLRE